MTAPKPEGFTAEPEGFEYTLEGDKHACKRYGTKQFMDLVVSQGVHKPVNLRPLYSQETIDTAIAERDDAVARVGELEELLNRAAKYVPSSHEAVKMSDMPLLAKIQFALSAAKAGGAG